MILFIRRIWAFIVRDLRLQLSYRMQFFLRVLSILTIVTTLFFISKIFTGFTDPRFAQWRDPLAAWLTGLAVLNYFMTGFSSLATAIRQEQVQGTLESVLMTPISVPTVIVASSAWDFLEATLFSSLYLLFGWLFFDVHYRGNFLLDYIDLLTRERVDEARELTHDRWVVNKVRALGSWYTKGLENGSHLRTSINSASSLGAELQIAV